MMDTVKTVNRVILRIAGPNDLPDIFRLVDSYEDGFMMDSDTLKNHLRDMVYIHGVIIAEYNGVVIGGVAGYALPCMFTEEILYSCMMFYVKKQYRRLTKSFVKELEMFLLPTNAKRLIFSTLATPDGYKLQHFFRSLGYTELETHFAKRF